MRWTVELAGGQSLGDRAGRILTEWDAVDDGGRVFRFSHPAMLPDLADPATLGCLLALVREAWGDPLAYTMACYGRWTLCSDRDEEIDPGDGPTEAEALVAALEAAPLTVP